MIPRLSLLALLALLLVPAAAWSQIAPEDVVNIQNVGAVAISPDGQTVAFTVSIPRTADDAPGRNFNEVRLVPFGGGEPTTLIGRDQPAGAPAWMADGRLAFVSRYADQHGQTQVYALSPAGGAPERLTDSPDGVMSFAISQDGNHVFYTSRQAEDPERARQRERGYDQIVAGEDERHVRLFVERSGGGDRRMLTPADMTVRDFVVAPDGRTVALQITDGVGLDYDMMFRQLHTLDLASGDMTRLAPTEGKLGPMAWSPDSRQVAFLSATRMSDPLPHSIFVADVASRSARNATPAIEATVEWMRWEDDSTLLFTAVEGTRTYAGRLNAETGQVTRVFGPGAEVMRSLSMADDGDRVAVSVNTRMHPNEVYVGSLASGDLQRITNNNPWLDDRRFARQETVTWSGAGGERIEGVLVYPLDYEEGQRYPLAILPHGGPEGISIDGWNTRALYPSHVMAREGYVVLKPNYRGSGGRGASFSMANHRDLGGTEFEDVILGVDHLAEIGLVDPERVGISGTSYGGYFSAWATTRHPDRFRAGITFAGLSNWVSFMGTTDIPHEMALVHWDLYYWEAPDLYHDRSPVSHVSERSTPTLVVHGLADERVHPEQSIQLYNHLRLRDVPTGLVLYPREPHGLLERAHQLDFMQRQIDWFGRYVMPEEVTTSAAPPVGDR
jgi:dipeptidyl aminopeptidase/acylaminoacyl peptidase